MKIRTDAWGGGCELGDDTAQRPGKINAVTPAQSDAERFGVGPAVEAMVSDVHAFGTGFISRSRTDDGAIRETHIPAGDVARFGVSDASEAKLSSFTMPIEVSPLDTEGAKRGKVSRLDGQATEGEVSPLDR